METLRAFVARNEHIQRIKAMKGRRELFLVGGTVRDVLLGLEPQDYDFAVSGSGIAFARSISRKIHGAFVELSEKDDEARVVKDTLNFDFVGTGDAGIEADLKRRDFTVNAMAVNCETLEFLDPHKGLKDLKREILRPTGECALLDDPVRVLRGFRFSAELGFSLSRNFSKLTRAVDLSKAAAERIGYEMMRIMAVPESFPHILKINTLGLFKQIFQEAEKIIEDDYLWRHSLGTYEAIEALLQSGFFTRIEPEFSKYFSVKKRIPLLKFAGLFHDVAKPDTFLLKNGEVHFYGHDAKGARIVQTLCSKRLKLSRMEVAIVRTLVKEHMRLHLLATSSELTDRAIRRFFRDLAEEWFGAMILAWADGYATAGWTRHLETVFTRMITLKREDDAQPKIDRLVNGHDLIAQGLRPGPKFKIILQELLDLQLEGKIKTKEEGLKIALEIHRQLKIH